MNKVVISIPIIHTKADLTEAELIAQMQIQVSKLLANGALKGTLDEILQDFVLDVPGGYINITIPQVALGMTNNLTEVAAGLCPQYIVPEDQLEQNIIEASDGTLRSFSMATIQERLRIATRNPKLRFRYTILDYKRYYKARKSTLEKDPEKAKKFRNMFLTDMIGMITEVIPFIEEGKQLGTLVGTSQVNPKLTTIARELSIIYKRALKNEKAAGMINKTNYSRLKDAYNRFMDQLVEVVMPGINEIIGGNKPENNNKEVEDPMAMTRQYSRTKDGRIRLFSDITSEEEFRKYAHNVMKNAHGDNYSEEVTNKVVDDLIKNNPDASWGELVGRLTSGLGE